MKSRRYTVGYRPSCPDYTIPEMRISGKWLKKIGFSIGDHVELVLGERQIIIRPAVDDVIPNMVEEAPGTVIPD